MTEVDQPVHDGVRPEPAHDRGLRLSVFFGALFFGLGVFVPFFPVWLAAQGLNSAEISIILASQMAVRIGSGPAFSFLADARGDRRAVVIALSLASLAGMVLLALVSGFWAILLLAVAASVVWTPILPLIEALAVSESEAGGPDYGRTRLWGSLTFIAGSMGGGYLLKFTEPGLIIWILVGAYLLMAATSFWLPPERARTETAARKARLSEVLPVLKHPVFLAFLGAGSLIQASHAFYYGFGTIHWQSLGIGDDVIGMLWAVGVVAEVVLFMFAKKSLLQLGPTGLIAAGAVAALVRWSLTALDPGVAWLVVIQVGHALTFGATHLGAMHFIARATPANYHATVQGVNAAVSGGIIMAVVMGGSGALFDALGGQGYLVMAGLGGLGGLFAVYVALRWDGGKLG